MTEEDRMPIDRTLWVHDVRGMTIEEAIVYVMVQRNGGMTTEQIAEAINRQRLHIRKDGKAAGKREQSSLLELPSGSRLDEVRPVTSTGICRHMSVPRNVELRSSSFAPRQSKQASLHSVWRRFTKEAGRIMLMV